MLSRRQPLDDCALLLGFRGVTGASAAEGVVVLVFIGIASLAAAGVLVVVVVVVSGTVVVAVVVSGTVAVVVDGAVVLPVGAGVGRVGAAAVAGTVLLLFDTVLEVPAVTVKEVYS